MHSELGYDLLTPILANQGCKNKDLGSKLKCLSCGPGRSLEPAVLDRLARLRDDDPDEEQAKRCADTDPLEKTSILVQLLKRLRPGGHNGRGRAEHCCGGHAGIGCMCRRCPRNGHEGAPDRREQQEAGEQHGPRENERPGCSHPGWSESKRCQQGVLSTPEPE